MTPSKRRRLPAAASRTQGGADQLELVLRAVLRRSGWCLRLRPGQRAGAPNLRRLAQGSQQGSALSLQFVHLCHGCLPMAPQGFRCTARQSCCALPTPGDSHRQEVPTTPQGREPTALQRSRAFPSASPGAVAPPCRCPLAAEALCGQGLGVLAANTKVCFKMTPSKRRRLPAAALRTQGGADHCP